MKAMLFRRQSFYTKQSPSGWILFICVHIFTVLRGSRHFSKSTLRKNMFLTVWHWWYNGYPALLGSKRLVVQSHVGAALIPPKSVAFPVLCACADVGSSPWYSSCVHSSAVSKSLSLGRRGKTPWGKSPGSNVVFAQQCLGQRYGLKTLSTTRKPPFITKFGLRLQVQASGFQLTTPILKAARSNN